MEEKIKEILTGKLHAMAGHNWLIGMGKDDCVSSAKEITSLMTEFIEWMIIKQEIFYGGLSEKYLLMTLDNIKFDTLEELFQYWHDNVKNKVTTHDLDEIDKSELEKNGYNFKTGV